MPESLDIPAQIHEAIGKLWSPDDAVRTSAKLEIEQLGTETIEPLVALLEDLIQNPYPRFSTGNEVEGRIALDNYRGTLQKGNSVQAGEQGRSYSEQISRLSINSRLIWDAIELLGHLRAERAIPLLIAVMESEKYLNLWEAMGLEMEALCRIGNAAVPQLLEVVENAHQHAADSAWLVLGYVVMADESDNEESGPDDDLGNDDTEQEIKERSRRIIARAAMVLGEIGDVRALPVIERLLASSGDEFVGSYIRPYIVGAIEKIRTKGEIKPSVDRPGK